MLLFGHIGLTLGATWGAHHVLEKKEQHPLLVFVRRLDYRIVMASSLLPDIIDKPVGAFFFRETYSNARIHGHTLVFFILLALAGFFLYKTRRLTWLLAVSIGDFTHIVFDRLWQETRTLFWPLLGTSFQRKDVSALIPPILQEPPAPPAPGIEVPVLDARDINNWIPDIVRNWFTDPRDYVPEIAGIAVLLFFAFVLVRKKKLLRFLKSGQVPIIGQR